MNGHGSKVLGAIALLGGFSAILSSHLKAGDRTPPTGIVRIGLISSLFSDVPEPTIMAMMEPFGALMEAHRKTKDQGGRLKLSNLGPNFKRALELARLLTIFETCPSEAAAIAGF